MRHQRQLELFDRIGAAGPRLNGLFGAASMVQQASAYTDKDRFDKEQRVLFRGSPNLIGLSVECPAPGDYLTAMFGGVPVAVIRQADGSLRAMLNVCRHRGAPILEGMGSGLRKLSCPYHAWTYGLDGTLEGRPMSDGAFDDVTMNCDLHSVAVAERYGLIFVRASGLASIDVDATLGGAQDDLGSYGLDHYTHFETRSALWKMNWKLVLDTFTESYHIRTLHKTTLAPTFHSGCVLFEPFGANVLSVGLRADVFDELAKPATERSLLPYATMQYFLVPSAMLCHQRDHVELWRLTPIDERTTAVKTSLFAPSEPTTEKARNYWRKNLDLLINVTATEDFTLMEKIQANLDSGALAEVIYGRIEPPLVHLHREINAALDGAT